MLYHVTRSGQNYGPYTLEDLRRYVASGNILVTDLAKSDEMAEWVTVGSLLQPAGSAPPPQVPYTPAFQPGYVAPAYPAAGYPAANVGENPPNLHWALLLLLSLVTCSLFAMIWSIILSAWMNRVAPASRQLMLGIAVVVGDIAVSMMKDHRTWDVHQGWSVIAQTDHAMASFFGMCWLILAIYARFNMRNAMERYYNTVEPIGLRLSGVMTFFFGGLYFQYHMNRINDLKRAAAYGAPRL